MSLEPDHQALQASFKAALRHEAPPAGLVGVDDDDRALRFAVYRNNVQYGLSRALAARFPVVERLVGPAFFRAMARVFIAASPPRDPVLLGWGVDFPTFLAGFPPVAALPYLPDVARLELARGRAFHAADATPVAPEILTSSDPATLRLDLHPSVEAFTSDHAAVSIWTAHQAATPPGPLRAAGAECALIGRRPDHTVIVEPIDTGTHDVLCALVAATPLGVAAERGDPTTALTLLLRHGLIVGAATGEPR
ncbi:MAG: DUF2063 domain-containing protein [Geminicoccaceae bacterium]|nr:MAG: DUF2063 domain-containing protein [Geminicoccaceae bacterium]